MTRRFAMAAVAVVAAGHAAGQTVLYGVRTGGGVVRVDPATGAATAVGGGGVPCSAGTSYNHSNIESILIGGGAATPDQIDYVNRWTGAVWYTQPTTGRPAGYEIRGMAAAYPALYVILGPSDPTAIDLLAEIDLSSQPGMYTVIGPTGRSDLGALAMSPDGSSLYALGTSAGGSLCYINVATGAATRVGGGGFGSDDRALEFLPDGTLLACGANVLSVAPTGATTLIGPTGFADVVGLAAVTRAGCYANCHNGPFDPPPLLNVLDFTCFMSSFAAGAPYANCDQSTTPPVLNVNDFVCFMASFAQGCP